MEHSALSVVLLRQRLVSLLKAMPAVQAGDQSVASNDSGQIRSDVTALYDVAHTMAARTMLDKFLLAR